MPSLWMVAGALAVVFAIAKYISYRRHPLYKFPGPLFCAISNIPFCYHMMKGDLPKWHLSLHEKYGPIVRLSPNELTFTTPTSQRDIYTTTRKNQTGAHQVFTKSYAYDAAAFTDQSRSIVNERDPTEHSKMRKMISPAFSERYLRDQTPLISAVSDRLIHQLSLRAIQIGTGEKVSLGDWLTMTTFETITDLALGENFGSLEKGKIHPWNVFFLNGARAMGDGVCLMRFPWLKKLVLASPPPMMKRMISELRRHEAITVGLVQKRQDNPVDRPDFLNRILEAQDPRAPFSTAYIAAQLSDCVIAGTDTTATATATANYYLLRHPAMLSKLQSEIRSTFKHYDEITPSSTAKLEYLNAVLNESMRIMPPVSWIPSRVVPPGGDTVDGHFLPGGVLVSTGYFAVARTEMNFYKPTEFHPERWLSSDSPYLVHLGDGELPGRLFKNDNLEASQPFSLGSRVCIGKQLAWIEMRLIMAKLHFKFDFEAVDGSLDKDWVEASKLRLLWRRPSLMVKVKERA